MIQSCAIFFMWRIDRIFSDNSFEFISENSYSLKSKNLYWQLKEFVDYAVFSAVVT